MTIPNWLTISGEVFAALFEHRPVVALESTLIAHGLPWPVNLETARAAQQAVRDAGAVPATIAVWQGAPTVGLSAEQIEQLAQAKDVFKASRRDLARAVSERRTAATTVAATIHLAHAAGIQVFATGGIGGAHRDAVQSFDISADLVELSRTPIMVVCAGAKSILDLARTLELLETLGVPVIGYVTDRFPAFYVRDTGLPVSARVDDAAAAARLFTAHAHMGGAGVVLAQPVAEEAALSNDEVQAAVQQAHADAANQKVTGAALTPFLLARLAELTGGKTLRTNQVLVVANARLAAEVAKLLSGHS
ncbi:MAG TPA: pseudouridine-5'-phosphate glycosidase [Gemmataceae bacterium]|nr:pseudouridine-5'-phosphate glycosidase [Gemmataceae bacterium]